MSRHELTGDDKLVIYGNGQMAKMFYHFAKRACRVVALTVDRELIGCDSFAGVPIVPFDEVEKHFPPNHHRMITAVGFVEMNRIREERYLAAKRKGYAFANYIHPSAVIHDDILFGENNVVLDHVSLHPSTRIGNSNFICSNTTIGHGCRVGDHCWINSGVSIAGETSLGSNCFVGINASIGDNIAIAERCYIGANTLITRSTEPAEVYVSSHGERFPLPSDDFLKFIQR